VPRFFVLGAGFSAAAGLPMAAGLIDKILKELERMSPNDGGWTHLHEGIEDYQSFVVETTGEQTASIDIERLMEFLDYRHYLGLLGSDTYSDEGNRDQELLRWGLGRVLHVNTPEVPDLYLQFAEKLRPRDVVITFNYDLLLERALESVGKRYRRFPNRYITCSGSFCTVDSEGEADEVLVLKLHGSIDWASRATFDKKVSYYLQEYDEFTAEFGKNRDLLFGPKSITSTRPLPEGPRPYDDPLASIVVLEDLDAYYSSYSVALQHPPLLLAPSRAKQLYGEPLRPFWQGLGQWGIAYTGLNIIGYSLPEDDDYVRQLLWELAGGYASGLEDAKKRVFDMARIQVVDLRKSRNQRAELRARYRFLPSGHTDFVMTGFSEDTLEGLFPEKPYRRADERHDTDPNVS